MKIHPQHSTRILGICLALAAMLYAATCLPAGEDGDPPTYKAEVLHVTETENEIKAFAPGSTTYASASTPVRTVAQRR